MSITKTLLFIGFLIVSPFIVAYSVYHYRFLNKKKGGVIRCIRSLTLFNLLSFVILIAILFKQVQGIRLKIADVENSINHRITTELTNTELHIQQNDEMLKSISRYIYKMERFKHGTYDTSW